MIPYHMMHQPYHWSPFYYASCNNSANHDVQKIFDLEYGSRKDRIKFEMAELVDRYKHKEGDTGAIEVQGKGW